MIDEYFPSGLTLCFRSNRDAEHAAVTLGEAFDVLVGSDSGDGLDPDQILINILQYVNQMITGDHTPMERKFTLLEICEPVLQNPRAPEAARDVIRKVRPGLAQTWERECDVLATRDTYVGWR